MYIDRAWFMLSGYCIEKVGIKYMNLGNYCFKKISTFLKMCKHWGQEFKFPNATTHKQYLTYFMQFITDCIMCLIIMSKLFKSYTFKTLKNVEDICDTY